MNSRSPTLVGDVQCDPGTPTAKIYSKTDRISFNPRFIPDHGYTI